eukprot:7111310-Ditylum_brightwellii.AAC.1
MMWQWIGAKQNGWLSMRYRHLDVTLATEDQYNNQLGGQPVSVERQDLGHVGAKECRDLVCHHEMIR